MIFGLEADGEFPAGWTPLEAVAVIECLDENGEPTLYIATTQNLSSWKSLGMLTFATRVQSDDLAEGTEDGPE